MKIDDLVKLVVSGELQELAGGMAPLKEPARAKLYSAYEAFWHACSSRESYVPLQGNIPEDYGWAEAFIVPERRMEAMLCVELAALGLGPQDTACKISMRQFYGPHWRYLVDVIESRRPTWADAWVAHLLDPETRPCAFWEPLRELFLRGVIARPHGEGYQRLLLDRVLFYERSLESSSRRLQSEASQLASDYLRENPDLLEELYPIFSVDLIDLSDYADPWKVDVQRGQEGPFHTLKTLAEEGLLDRARLLALSLDGVMSSRSQRLRTRYANFHEGMEPTGEEVEQLQGAYLALLDLPEENLAAFGVKMLKKVDGAKALDEAAYVRAAIPLLERKGKGMVKTVLAQLQKIGAKNTELAAEIVSAVSDLGLGHADRDVQEASLKLLEQWKGGLTSAAREVIGVRAEEVATTLRDRARALVAASGQGEGGNATVKVKAKPKAKAKAKVKVKTEPTSEKAASKKRKMGKAADAAPSLDSEVGMPPPRWLDTSKGPVLTGLEPLRPVVSLDEAIGLAAQYIEGKCGALEVEQLMDAISCIDPATEKQFDRLGTPLLARLQYPRWELEHLLHFWLSRGAIHEGYTEAIPNRGEWGKPFWRYQAHRLRAIRERISKGIFVPLLSTPSHAGGWLAPVALVARLNAMCDARQNPDTLDLIQALLRLAPDGREEAAKELPAGKKAWHRVVGWALTGKGKAAKGDDPDLWLAAARARNPRGVVDIPGLDNQTILGPDGAEAARYRWLTKVEVAAYLVEKEKATTLAWERAEQQQAALLAMHGLSEEDFVGRFEEYMAVVEQVRSEAGETRSRLHDSLVERFGLLISPAWRPGVAQVSRPTVSFHGFPCAGSASREESLELPWSATIWPHNRDAFFAVGLVNITDTFEQSSSKLWPEYGYLVPLFEPHQSITAPAATLIGLALFAPQGDLSRTAIDVLVETIADGRAHPDLFAEPLPRICATKWFQPGRMAGYLKEVAQVSPLHTWAVAQMVQSVISEWSDMPKNGHHLLELLLESLAGLGVPLGDSTAKVLGGMNCSGKSAKLVKQLLALEATDTGTMAEAQDLATRA